MNPIDLSAKNSPELILSIDDVARGGKGVARAPDGRVVFLPFTAPGDRVRARLVTIKRRYADGEVLEWLERGPQRETPKCPVFGQCGGCEWQHLPYSLQWKIKVKGAKAALKRVGIEAPATWEEFPAKNPWEYRNRVQLRGHKNEIGFFAHHSHEVVAIDRCDIARPEINEALAAIRDKGARHARPYKVEVEVDEIGQISQFWNSPHSSHGFRQVNDEQNAVLREWIRAHVSPGCELFDLYGGGANLSAQLQGVTRAIHCVDNDIPEGAQDRSPQVKFHRNGVVGWLTGFLEPQLAAREVILDPPRSGLGEQGSLIAELLEKRGVKKAILVSCDPDSWASDLLKFTRRSWCLESCANFDMFPQTHHLESAGMLTAN